MYYFSILRYFTSEHSHNALQNCIKLPEIYGIRNQVTFQEIRSLTWIPIQPGQQTDSHLKRITSTNYGIHTVVPPGDLP